MCDWYPSASLFAVFDGHGGPAVSILASRLLSKRLQQDLDAKQGSTDETSGQTAWHSEFTRRRAVQTAFLAVDNQLAAKSAAVSSGSTCTAAAIWHKSVEDTSETNKYHVLLANLGDSRGLVVDFASKHLKGETFDHKPEHDMEHERITQAGGVVTSPPDMPSRINGDLSVSRSFGDFRLKDCETLSPDQQKVSPLPDIYEIECQGGDIVVLACDGAFDVLESSEVSALVCNAVAGDDASKDLSSVARAVVEEALNRGSTDNVTCVVVQLLAMV
jgi:serine/threonine protein phosphatase PrpC